MSAVMGALLHLLPLGSQAQAGVHSRWADSAAALIERAVTGELADGADRAVALADHVLAESPRDGVMLHFKGYALYRKANSLRAAGASDAEVREALVQADATLRQSAAVLPWPETFALRAALTGQLIGVSSMFSAMRLGPRANDLIEQAMALGPANPRVWMLRGVSALYKPAVLGGGTGKAERDIRKAIELFATEHPAPPAPGWGRAEAYAWLGQVYARDRRVEDARAAYGQALALQPTFTWVTRELLPALDRIKR